MSVNMWSPPKSGTTSAQSTDAAGGITTNVTSVCQRAFLPPAAGVELQYLGMSIDTGHHGMRWCGFTDRASQGHLVCGRKLLAPTHDDAVVE